MSGRIHPTALIGEPPESRDFNASPGERFAPMVDPSAILNAYVTVDAGLRRATTVGARSFLMTKTHVGHDAIIGDDCELAPGAVVCGHAELGDGVRMGVNSCVRPVVKVGAGARIGMGAVVVRDVPAGEVWVGNPAQPIRQVRATGIVLTDLEVEGWEQLTAGASCV